MNPVVRAVSFMGKTILIIVVLLCTAWWTVLFYLLSVYGPLGGVVLILGSITLPSLAYGMKRSDDRRRDRHVRP